MALAYPPGFSDFSPERAGIGLEFGRPEVTDSFERLRLLNQGDVCRHATGLAEPPRTYAEHGIDAYVYYQPRVEAFDKFGNVTAESEIVKARTMVDPTEDGHKFIQELVELVARNNHPDMNEKQIKAWLVRNRFAELARSASADEIPQLLFNVWGLTAPGMQNRNLMKMLGIGGARPVMAHEIAVVGDNSNDNYCRALELIGDIWNIDGSVVDVNAVVSEAYEPGLATMATAKGHRQIGTVDQYVAWIKGLLAWSELKRTSSPARLAMARMAILAGTTAHVIKRTNAA